jgi:EmrB/QacA subfamily drug resistance transporter
MSATSPTPAAASPSAKAPDWLILAIACLGQFMVVLDVSVVNVALPAIRSDLHYTATGLQWVVNAYVLTFAGFLLLGGRVADLFGRRRVFLTGVGLFSLASLTGGLSQSSDMLTVARAVQGFGGAILAPATLTVIMTTFTDPTARTKALGTWSAVAGGGAAAGVLLGGVLTTYLSWRWVLFINVPVGVALGLVAARSLTESRRPTSGTLDVAGAVTVTGGLAALIYAIVGTDTHAWTSGQTLGGLAIAVVLLALFLAIQLRLAPSPLVPLRLFRSRALSAANGAMLLFGAAFFAIWYFLSLYLQGILGYDALKTGLAFLPLCVAIIAGARITAQLVPRLGARNVLLIGLPLAAIGFAWLSRARVDSSYVGDVLGPGLLISLALGLCLTPLAAAATGGVPSSEAGLASGVITTSRQVGGSIGLAVLATIATDRTNDALRRHTANAAVLTTCYDRAFLVCAGFIVVAVISAAIIPTIRRNPVTAPAGSEAGSAEEVPVLDL